MEVLTVSEFSEQIGFSRKTVLRWIKEGRITAFRVNKEYRIPISEIERIANCGITDEMLGD